MADVGKNAGKSLFEMEMLPPTTESNSKPLEIVIKSAL